MVCIKCGRKVSEVKERGTFDFNVRLFECECGTINNRYRFHMEVLTIGHPKLVPDSASKSLWDAVTEATDKVFEGIMSRWQASVGAIAEKRREWLKAQTEKYLRLAMSDAEWSYREERLRLEAEGDGSGLEEEGGEPRARYTLPKDIAVVIGAFGLGEYLALDDPPFELMDVATPSGKIPDRVDSLLGEVPITVVAESWWGEAAILPFSVRDAIRRNPRVLPTSDGKLRSPSIRPSAVRLIPAGEYPLVRHPCAVEAERRYREVAEEVLLLLGLPAIGEGEGTWPLFFPVKNGYAGDRAFASWFTLMVKEPVLVVTMGDCAREWSLEVRLGLPQDADTLKRVEAVFQWAKVRNATHSTEVGLNDRYILTVEARGTSTHRVEGRHPQTALIREIVAMADPSRLV